MEELLKKMSAEERLQFLKGLCAEILEENAEAFEELAK